MKPDEYKLTRLGDVRYLTLDEILAIISHHFALPIEDLTKAVQDGIPTNKGEK